MTDIKITSDELRDSRIDEVINMEKALTQRTEGEYVEDVPTPFYLNPVFYYGVTCAVGAFIVWAIAEPYINDKGRDQIPLISNFLAFGPLAGMIGLSLGLVYGFVNRNVKQMLHCGAVGLGVGFAVTLITSFIAGLLYGFSIEIAVGIMGKRKLMANNFQFTGAGFFMVMCGRGLAWSVVSMGAGMGLGIALKSKKLVLNGLAGGMVGGILGGLMFDPIYRFVLGNPDEASVSRAVGLVTVGLLVGVFIGFFENISKDSWFLMIKGPLAGKQFNLFKSPMVIGSAPSCDIYLFKDAAIAPSHASVTKSGTKYTLSSEGGMNELYVNGRRITQHILQSQDVISIGDTVLKYQEQQKK